MTALSAPLLIYTIGLLTHEKVRNLLCGEPIAKDEQVQDQDHIPGSPSRRKGKKEKCYSGLFVLLKQKGTLPDAQKSAVLGAGSSIFLNLVPPLARTFF